jgi:hypothetical protein
MRRVLAAAAIDSHQVALWSLYGAAYDGQQGANPTLDYPIPEPGAIADPSIHVYLNTLPSAVAFPPARSPVVVSGSGGSDVFSRMDAEWKLCLLLEQQLAAASKQLNGTQLRLNSLNRDLSSEEARAADQLDKKDWQDARRWLRDISARISRFLKDHHIGMTSTAGKRGAFEAIYEQYVVPRRQFEGIAQSERDFEQYHKTLQTLLNNMNAAQTTAVQDGERRAQLILQRISAKARAARTTKKS